MNEILMWILFGIGIILIAIIVSYGGVWLFGKYIDADTW